MQFFKRIYTFFKDDIWKLDTAKVPKFEAGLIRVFRIFLIVFQGISKSQIQFVAYSLVYYTLLSFVPALAILIRIARRFHIEDMLTNWLVKGLGEQKQAVHALVDFAKSALAE